SAYVISAHPTVSNPGGSLASLLSPSGASAPDGEMPLFMMCCTFSACHPYPSRRLHQVTLARASRSIGPQGTTQSRLASPEYRRPLFLEGGDALHPVLGGEGAGDQLAFLQQP